MNCFQVGGKSRGFYGMLQCKTWYRVMCGTVSCVFERLGTAADKALSDEKTLSSFFSTMSPE